METINLATAGRRIIIKDEQGGNYFIDVAPGDYLLLIASIEYGRAAFNFDHPSILARLPRVFEYKHYRRAGSKFWTSAPGMELVFAVHKRHIEVIPEPGYSYVKVKIAGEQFTLNVSGGTGTGGWTDYINPVAGLCGTRKVTAKQLKALSSMALDPVAATLCGVRLPERWKKDKDEGGERFAREVAKRDIPAKLVAGSLIHLAYAHFGKYVFKVNYRGHGIRINDKESKKRYVICEYTNMNLRVKFSQIDWPKTAEVNGWTLPKAEADFRIPFEPTAQEAKTA